MIAILINDKRNSTGIAQTFRAFPSSHARSQRITTRKRKRQKHSTKISACLRIGRNSKKLSFALKKRAA